MSLDRAAVIRQYKQLSVAMDLPCDQLVLGAGAALVMMGLRKTTSDLDVDVPKDFFEKQKARKGFHDSAVGEVVAWDGLTDIRAVTPDVIEGGKMEIHGVWVHHPVVLHSQKTALANHPGRSCSKTAQDRKDLHALEVFIADLSSSKALLINPALTRRIHKAKP